MRSISQIYSEAVSARNKYLQITELNSGQTESKLSMLNLLTYVTAVCIHSYESMMDLFQVRIAQVLSGRINGTPDWYALMVKKFQYNPSLKMGDELVFNEDTMKIEYAKIDTSHRIIAQSAWEADASEDGIILKVCKANSSAEEIALGVTSTNLTAEELTALKQFISQTKFVGASVYCQSLPVDKITLDSGTNSAIFFDDRYTTAEKVSTAIKEGLIAFSKSHKFNDYVYYQNIIDIIRHIPYVVDFGNSIKVRISTYDSVDEEYKEWQDLVGRFRPASGHISFAEKQGEELVINISKLKLVPSSKMDEFYGR